MLASVASSVVFASHRVRAAEPGAQHPMRRFDPRRSYAMFLSRKTAFSGGAGVSCELLQEGAVREGRLGRSPYGEGFSDLGPEMNETDNISKRGNGRW